MKRFLCITVLLVFLVSSCMLSASAENAVYRIKILYTRKGTVTVDHETAGAGEQITVTATGNAGYRPYVSTVDQYSAASIYCGEKSIDFDWLTNRTGEGENGSFGSSEIVFTMPEGDVTVRVPFLNMEEIVPGYYTVSFSLETVDASGKPIGDSAPAGRIEGGGRFPMNETGYVIVIPDDGYAFSGFRCEPERNDIGFSLDDDGHRVLFWGSDDLQDFHITVSLTQTVPKRVPGDANSDGYADMLDALRILQIECGQDAAVNTANADVNGDGEADISDALLILQYACGWDVTLR